MVEEYHVTDALPAYALGCLEEVESLQVAEHLSGCEYCRGELRQYQSVVDQMALATPRQTPSSKIKEKLFAEINRAKSTAQPELGWWQRWAAGLRRFSPVLGTAAMFLVLLLGFSNVWLFGQVNQLRLQSAGAMQVVTLKGTDFTPASSGVLILSQDGSQGTLVVDRLPALAANQQYQLWLIHDGLRENGGVFSVDLEGYANVYVHSNQPLNSYSSFGITIEPFGGSSGPTGDKVLGGEL